MTKLLLPLVTIACLFAQPAGNVTVTKLQVPEKALKFEVIVPAKLDDVWNAFTTHDGLVTWLWSDVSVELKNGGEWTVHFPGGSTGGGTIASFTPSRQIVMRAMAPDKFPTVRRERTIATWDFEPHGAETKVTLTQTGWKAGKEWDEAYDYLAAGNAQLLEQLRYRFVKGPINWSAAK